MSTPFNTAYGAGTDPKDPYYKIEQLKTIPLFSELTQYELAYIEPLAQVIAFQRGDFVYRQGDYARGLYLFVQGAAEQVRIADDRREYREQKITAGMFVGEHALFLSRAETHSLEVTQNAVVLVIYRRQFEQLLREHKEIRARLNMRQDIVRQRLDIELENVDNRLARVSKLPLFSELDEDEVRQLAALFSVQTYGPGEYIYRQGELAGALIYFVQGRGIQLYVDASGVERKGRPVEAGDFVGERSLFMFEERPNSLVVVRETVALVLAQREFDDFIVRPENQRIRARLNVPADVLRLAPGRDFSWLNDGEQVLLFTRRHRWAFYQRSLWAVPLFFIFLPLPVVLFASPLPLWMGVCSLFPLALAPLIAIIYNYLDWRNDWFVVTNQRVVHEENVLLAFHETRQQAPLTSIQAVQSQQNGYWAERFGFGNVIISTAGAGGSLVFDKVTNPDEVRALISSNLNKRQALQYAEDRSRIRQEIDRFLGTSVLTRSRAEDLPPPRIHYTSPEGEDGPEDAPKGRRSWVGRRWEKFAAYLDIRTRFEEPGPGGSPRIVYRKHWIVLWNDIFPPTFFLIAWLTAFIISFIWRDSWPWANMSALLRVVVFAVTLALGLAWWWWMYEDWHNDRYVLEGDNLLRVHQRPLWLQNEQDSIPLSQIQGVNSQVEGIWQRLFNYGTIVVQTGADANSTLGDNSSGEYRFSHVYKPSSLEEDILRRRQEEQIEDQREDVNQAAREIARWLAIYHQATHPEDFVDDYSVPDEAGHIGDDLGPPGLV